MSAIVAAPSEAAAIAAACPGVTILDPTGPLPAEPVAIWLDGLNAGDVAALEATLTPRGRVDIAVAGTRADGFHDPPLVHLCRGLIAGFGHAGLTAAVRLLDQG